jgi:ubiquinone/menaquinone biosynthesis C-methylase UbiE
MTQQVFASLAENHAEIYESILVPAIYGAWADMIVEIANPRKGDRSLDVACGTGVVTRRLSLDLGITGEVSGLDCDPCMLAAARVACRGRGSAPIQFDQGSATAIPYKDEMFEVVTCLQGLPYFANRATVLREIYRVMTAGGRLAMVVWRGIDHSPAFLILAAVLDHYLGAEASTPIREAFVMEQEAEILNLLVQARFRSTKVQAVTGTAHFASVEEFFRSQVFGTPLAAQLAAMDQTKRTELFTVLSNALKPFVSDEGLSFPMGAYVISTKK